MSHGGGGRRHKKGGHEEEEHENHERWLVTYADMLTLLMVLFIVLFAISQVDQKKFAALKDGLAAGFGAPIAAMDGGTGPLDDTGIEPQPLDLFSSVTTPDAPGAQDPELAKAVARAQLRQLSQQRAEAERQVKQLEDVQAKLTAQLKKRGLLDSVRFTIDQRGLVVTIITNRVIFASDRADLAPDGKRVIDSLAPVLDTVSNDLVIEGHTNTVKVKPKYFESDLHLSSARAAEVGNYLITAHHFAAGRISTTGYGATHPLYPASNPQADTLNRRVEIVVTTGLTKAVAAEVAAVAAADGHASTAGTTSGSSSPATHETGTKGH